MFDLVIPRGGIANSAREVFQARSKAGAARSHGFEPAGLLVGLTLTPESDRRGFGRQTGCSMLPVCEVQFLLVG